MHALAPLLAAAVLALSGCATAAQGASDPSGSAKDSSAPVRAPANPSDPVPSTAAASGASAGPATPASSPSPSSSPSSSPSPSSLIDTTVIGAPAPVGALVLGDSISLSVADDLSRYGYPVIGLVGQSASASYLRTHLSTPLAQAARTWVIVLGTNNSGSPADVAQLAGMVHAIDGLRTPGARQQVRWVTPHRPDAYVGTKTAYTLDGFNAELSRLSFEHPWLRVLDFDVLAKAHPEWFDADTAMHLHPDELGQDALVALITGPAPRPADAAAPVLDGSSARSPSQPEPETFDNGTLAPSRAPDPTPTPTPEPSAPAPEPPASPAPAASSARPAASATAAVSP